MTIREIFKFDKEKLFRIPINKENSLYFYMSYFLFLAWMFFTFVSIFFIGLKNIFDAFVIFSILIRIIMIFAGLIFFKIIFMNKVKDKRFYNYFKAFVGYGVIFTYVFYSLPRIVGEFYGNSSLAFSIFNFSYVVFITIFPAFLYVVLRLGKTRLIFEVCTKKDLEFEKRMKKDKNLKKKEQKRIRSERSFLENLWYEWIDVIIQAIIIAMLIQQFLFQMYQIPSESMVPTFIIKDRVLANKFIYGPHIPLTEWKLPAFTRPKIGDIVVFNNPEMDDPNSDIRYNNVFSRIFHPFIYMLTFSLLDIDKKPNGAPKERLLVKRLIAEEGEKICMLNDKVYKKTENSDWRQMEGYQDQKEYGRVDLFYDDNPQMNSQFITREMRSILDESQLLTEKDDIENLKKELISDKNVFISTLKNKNIKNTINKLTYLSNNYTQIRSINGALVSELKNIFYANKLKLLPDLVKSFEDNAHKLFEKYHSVVLYFYLNDLANFLNSAENIENVNQKINFIDKNIYTDIKVIDSDDPYTKYMRRVNAIHKISRLKLFTYILNNTDNRMIESLLEKYNDYYSVRSALSENQFEILHDLYLVSFYLYGPYLYYMGYDVPNLFVYRNFPEFPKKTFIEKNQYFMMGDNRYNSYDNRFDNILQNNPDRDYFETLDKDDDTLFSTRVLVDWYPMTISISHVLGKAKAIYWPPDRIKIFK